MTILENHLNGMILWVFVFCVYYTKEIMELLLRVVFGIDRRVMYVPVAQNMYADYPFIGNVRYDQRGELFYYVVHFIVAFCIATIFYILAVVTPPETHYS